MKTRGVYERDPGSGVWWIRYADVHGRIRREKAGTKSAAIALQRKRKTQVLEGRKLPEKFRKPAVTLDEIARDVLAYSKARKRTHKEDAARMKRLLGWFGRDRPAESLMAQEIERRFEDAVDENDWAPSTINHHRSLLSLMFALAIRNGKIAVNPARATRHRREDNSRARFLRPDEESRLRNVVETKWPQHLAELDLALHTGLRRSEMYGVAWEDVNLAGRILLVRRGKNGEPRHVRLNTVALKALADLRKRSDGKGSVVRNLAGAPLKGPRHWFERATREAAVANFRWHDLRHTFASRLAMLGVSLRAIQEAMGHKGIAMTVRYAHLAPDFLQGVVDKLAPAPDTDEADRTDTTTGTVESSEVGGGEVKIH